MKHQMGPNTFVQQKSFFLIIFFLEKISFFAVYSADARWWIDVCARFAFLWYIEPFTFSRFLSCRVWAEKKHNSSARCNEWRYWIVRIHHIIPWWSIPVANKSQTGNLSRVLLSIIVVGPKKKNQHRQHIEAKLAAGSRSSSHSHFDWWRRKKKNIEFKRRKCRTRCQCWIAYRVMRKFIQKKTTMKIFCCCLSEKKTSFAFKNEKKVSSGWVTISAKEKKKERNA